MYFKKLIIVTFYSSLLYVCACVGNNQPKTVYHGPPTTTTTTGVTTGTTPTNQFIWKGALEINNVRKYHSLLREQRRCDPCSIKNAGNSSCNRFRAIADMELTFNKEELPAEVILKITPLRGYSWGEFNVGFCGYSHPNPTAPLIYKGEAKYSNNYDGFYARFYKSADVFGQSGLSYVILKSDYGLPADRNTLDVIIYYGGTSKDNNEMGTAELNHPSAEPTYGFR